MVSHLDKLQGIINGAIGDYLAKEHSALAINMGLYHSGQPLKLNESLEPQVNFPLSNKLVILLHGLTNLETIWQFNDDKTKTDSFIADDYGQGLLRDHEFTPFYLRYNTGLDIESNGKIFNHLLEQLLDNYPIPVDEILLIDFSMGGLVARCAQIEAHEESSTWLSKLQQCIYIGTPHEGAPLEKLTDVAGSVLASFPQPYINTWENWLNGRSKGIQSLKTGLYHRVDSNATDNSTTNNTSAPSFTPSAQHCFISGSISNNKIPFANALIGDSLVRKQSANPRSAPNNSVFAHFEGKHHLSLAHSPAVYQQISEWVQSYKSDTPTKLFSNTDSPNKTKPAKNTGSGGNVERAVATKLSAIKLALKGYEKTLDTIELMHNTIADEPYSLLAKAPVTHSISGVIHKHHLNISNLVFGSLRKTGDIVNDQVSKLDKP